MTKRIPTKRDPVDGILLLDKPVGLSSNDALLRARRLLEARKAGHGGTLDPLAGGLLPLLFGEATKVALDSLDADKTYVAGLRLGVTTDSGDAEGRVLDEREPVRDAAAFAVAVAAFVGPIDQVPPMHSALKRDGRPLYELARAGLVVERAPRRVTIHAIDVLRFAPPHAELRVRCSKGTYIRSLAIDLGERLGCGAHLSALRRERVGALDLRDAVTLEALEALALAERRARLLPADALLLGLPRVDLDAAQGARFRHGQKLRLETNCETACETTCADASPRRVRVYGAGQELLGVALQQAGELQPQRLVAAPIPAPPAAGTGIER
ncbi:MAG: tRNA pseudouridine(55) synthase TruB [Burkholderiaceae bacterium]|nr:tRNA pseudouridine(55) synthase TruB [Burkholderiaceae bacterium]